MKKTTMAVLVDPGSFSLPELIFGFRRRESLTCLRLLRLLRLLQWLQWLRCLRQHPRLRRLRRLQRLQRLDAKGRRLW